MSITVTLRIETEALQADLRKLEYDLMVKIRDSLDEASDVAKLSAQQTTLFKDRTGRTRASLRTGLYEAPRTGAFLVATGDVVKYKGGTGCVAEFLEYGTRAHVIKPKKAGGYLYFYWDKVGAWVRARQVHHPGTARRPWMTQASWAGGQALSLLLEEGADELFTAFNAKTT